MLKCDGFEACIVVDGQKCTQYGVEYEEGDAVAGPKASCWIASTADKVRILSTIIASSLSQSCGLQSFAINVAKEVSDDDFAVRVYLDERLVTYILYPKSSRGAQTIASVWVSVSEIRNFVFSSLALTGEQAACHTFGRRVNLLIVCRRRRVSKFPHAEYRNHQACFMARKG